MKDLDKKILIQLLKNCRKPAVEIAKKIGTSRQTVAKKLKELRSAGIIESFPARLNPEKLGLATKAYILLRESPQEEKRKRDEMVIRRIPQVSEFHRLFGEYSAVIEVLARDTQELYSIIKKIHKLTGVRETETFIVHSTIKEKPESPLLNVLKSS
ncbi:MAG: Lrp/AsnC family transcriptional regulator [Hadesarchaea archaeon]|nr:Lrp/AsnC family transcriptional regulator [Hadesarchaea archaeon]